jgi:hypothetical protein
MGCEGETSLLEGGWRERREREREERERERERERRERERERLIELSYPM